MDHFLTLLLWALVAVTLVIVLGAQIWEAIFPPKPPAPEADPWVSFWAAIFGADRKT